MPSPDQLTDAVAWFAALAHALRKRDRQAERKARAALDRLGVIVRFRKPAPEQLRSAFPQWPPS